MKSPAKYAKYLRSHIRQNKKTFLVYSILRVLVILTLVRQIIIHNWEGAGVCALSLVLFLAPSFMEDNFKIVIPPAFEATIYIFIYAAEILGEVNNFYVNIPGWDTWLHTLNDFHFSYSVDKCKLQTLYVDTFIYLKVTHGQT